MVGNAHSELGTGYPRLEERMFGAAIFICSYHLKSFSGIKQYKLVLMTANPMVRDYLHGFQHVRT